MSYGFEKEGFARFCMIPPPFHFVTQIRPFLNHACFHHKRKDGTPSRIFALSRETPDGWIYINNVT